jgi:uncharacterized protein YegP (UPF0339 family)
MMGNYVDYLEVLQKTVTGKWYYRGRSDNGEILFNSQKYKTHEIALTEATLLAGQLSVVIR